MARFSHALCQNFSILPCRHSNPMYRSLGWYLVTTLSSQPRLFPILINILLSHLASLLALRIVSYCTEMRKLQYMVVAAIVYQIMCNNYMRAGGLPTPAE